MVITKQVWEMTPVEYRACYAANYGEGGYMRGELVNARHSPNLYPAMVIMIWDGEQKVSSLKAWALLTKVRTTGCVAGSRYTKKKSKWTAQFWVKRQYRRQGWGKFLMDEVIKHDPTPHVFPHDENSAKLFGHYKVVASKGDRQRWMRKKAKAS